MEAIQRIHHISAIVGGAQENLDFYRDILGLKLVKKTVNFEDPNVYHLYYSNKNVDNGTIMTFFPWENAKLGTKGSGQVGRIAFRIPKDTIGEWELYLANSGVEVVRTNLFGKETLEFQDPHTLDLALVESDETSDSRDILGFHGSVLLSSNPEGTAKTLADNLGLEKMEDVEGHYLFETVGKERHQILIPKEAAPAGRWGVGTVHHIAWSVPDRLAHLEYQEYLLNNNYRVTEVKDRKYFEAIYMREPGHVIFEFATDLPGFDVDEPFETLGTELKLPAQFEEYREKITKNLPPLK